MVINPPLILVSALFFLSLSAVMYVVAWASASALLRFGGAALSPSAAKRILITALVLPPVFSALMTVGGAALKHAHQGLAAHHAPLCEEVFAGLFRTTGLHGSAAAGWAVNGLAWLAVAAGGFHVARLILATIRLERGLTPFLQPPSPKLDSALAAVTGDPRMRSSIFSECAIPPVYSSVLGFLKVRCILSRDFVREATDAELRAVVAHEAAHVSSRDAHFTLLVGALNCLFFFVRPVRLLAIRWREEAELACDAAAVGVTGDPLAMASAILRVSGVPRPARPSRRALPATALAFADEAACPPQKRVERLIAQAQGAALPFKQESVFQVAGAWAATLLLTALGMAGLASAQAVCYAHCSLEAIARLIP